MVKITQKKCDKLLTPWIKQIHPTCLLCGGETQVAHHHCHKSKSLVLRYDEQTLIPLCSSCHLKLHWNESYWASMIVKIKGLEWFSYIEKKKQETMKPDYEEIYNRIFPLITPTVIL